MLRQGGDWLYRAKRRDSLAFDHYQSADLEMAGSELTAHNIYSMQRLKTETPKTLVYASALPVL
ncbi:hypothetical protein L484_022040 [Morus notabilis]|uniref:Uncharacterized protein n=1 Tax=Morus notabilis TaxID=981085 RepID=W9S010_9ROSA|nr:hypothetical protein L484_022040 [Morus notabilis]